MLSRSRLPIAASVALSFTAFLIDLVTSAQFDVGLIYAAAVLPLLRVEDDRAVLGVAVLASVLAVLAFFATEREPAGLFDWSGRTLVVSAIWSVAWFTRRWQRPRISLGGMSFDLSHILARMGEASSKPVFGLAVFDARSRCVAAGGWFAELGSLPTADHVGRSPKGILPENGAALEIIMREAVNARDIVLDREVQLPTEAGARTILASFFPLRDPRGGGRGVIAFTRDVTERKIADAQRTEALADLERERDFLAAVLASLPVGVELVDAASGRLLHENPEVTRIWRASPHPTRFGGGPTRTGLPAWHTDGRALKAAEWPIARVLSSEQSIRGSEVDIERGDRTRGTVLVNAEPVRNQAGKMIAAVAVVEDITERKRAERRTEHLALHDSLTGLPNRLLFNHRIEQDLAAATRSGAGAAVMIVDFDLFKEVNDAMGHQAGDIVLQAAAGRLKSRLRAGDTIARLGGDEFAVLQRGISSSSQASALADKLLDVLTIPFETDYGQARIGASIGIALFPEDGDNASQLLRCADLALYSAKHAGRRRYVLFDRSLETARRTNEDGSASPSPTESHTR